MKKALNPLLTELKGYIGATYTKQSKGNLKKAATLKVRQKGGTTYGYVYFRYKPLGTQKNGRKKKTASLYVRWLTNGTRNIHGTNFVVNFRKDSRAQRPPRASPAPSTRKSLLTR